MYNCNISLADILSTEIIDNLIYAKVKLLRNNVIIDDVLLVNYKGISGEPQIASKCLVLNADENFTRYYGLAIDTSNELSTQKDAITLYGRGTNKVLFMDSGNIDIISDGNKITLKGNSIEITGNVKITGNLEVSGDSTLTGNGTTIAGKNFLTHTHSGVTAGGGVTGGVV